MPLDRNTSFHTDSGLSLQHIIEFKIKITRVLKRGPPKLQFNSKTLTTYYTFYLEKVNEEPCVAFCLDTL